MEVKEMINKNEILIIMGIGITFLILGFVLGYINSYEVTYISYFNYTIP